MNFKLYQLNNSGSRWAYIATVFTAGKVKNVKKKLPVKVNGVVKERAVDYWEQCGNFAHPVVRIGGKRVAVFPHTEVPLPGEKVIWMTYGDKYSN